MITSPKDKIKILPIQEEYKQEYKSFDRNSIGYTDRPLNARTQTYNRYLDSYETNGDITINTMSLGYINTSNQTNKVGNLTWKTTNIPYTLYIPVEGTYSIHGDVFISSALGSGRLRVSIEKNGIDDIKVVYINVEHKTNTPIILNYNFIKGDYIRIYLDNESSDTIDATVNISITKIS